MAAGFSCLSRMGPTAGRPTAEGATCMIPSRVADLGAGPGWIVLEFNYAYSPSCAYDEQWVCLLAPQENRLPFAAETGEKAFPG
jgi:uncharacterized protein (DUF1684 family)